MPAPVTTELVWKALSNHHFAVLSWVTQKGEPRSAGIVYLERERKLYVATDESSWKARQIRATPHVAVTATFPRRIALLPWIPIPDATIGFQGRARVIDRADAGAEMCSALTQGMTNAEDLIASMCIIEVTPLGDFVTYGIGVSTMQMRDAEKAMGRAPVA